MSMDLNLLPDEAKFQIEKIKLKKRARKMTVMLVIGWVAISVVVGVGYLLSLWNWEAASKKNAVAVKQLQGLSGNIVSNQQLRYKAKLVESIIKNRFEYYLAFKSLTDLFSANVMVKNYNLTDERSFTVEGEAMGTVGMNELEDKLLAINQGGISGFKEAKLKDLSKQGQKWIFSLEVGIK